MPGHSDGPPDLDPLDLIPGDRRAAVREWLTTPLADCGICGDPVFPTSPRAIDGNTLELGHLDCLKAPLADCPACNSAITRLDVREELKGFCSTGNAQRRRGLAPVADRQSKGISISPISSRCLGNEGRAMISATCRARGRIAACSSAVATGPLVAESRQKSPAPPTAPRTAARASCSPISTRISATSLRRARWSSSLFISVDSLRPPRSSIVSPALFELTARNRSCAHSRLPPYAAAGPRQR